MMLTQDCFQEAARCEADLSRYIQRSIDGDRHTPRGHMAQNDRLAITEPPPNLAQTYASLLCRRPEALG
jgi:hypothetical protein